VYLKVISSSSL